MKPLKYLEGRIHGWLPKETYSPSCQQATTHRFFPTHKAIVAFVVLVVGSGFAGFLLGRLGDVLGISSMFGIFWPLITSMVVTFVFLFIYDRIRRKEEQKEARTREL